MLEKFGECSKAVVLTLAGLGVAQCGSGINNRHMADNNTPPPASDVDHPYFTGGNECTQEMLGLPSDPGILHLTDTDLDAIRMSTEDGCGAVNSYALMSYSRRLRGESSSAAFKEAKFDDKTVDVAVFAIEAFYTGIVHDAMAALVINSVRLKIPAVSDSEIVSVSENPKLLAKFGKGHQEKIKEGASVIKKDRPEVKEAEFAEDTVVFIANDPALLSKFPVSDQKFIKDAAGMIQRLKIILKDKRPDDAATIDELSELAGPTSKVVPQRLITPKYCKCFEAAVRAVLAQACGTAEIPTAEIQAETDRSTMMDRTPVNKDTLAVLAYKIQDAVAKGNTTFLQDPTSYDWRTEGRFKASTGVKTLDCWRNAGSAKDTQDRLRAEYKRVLSRQVPQWRRESRELRQYQGR